MAKSVAIRCPNCGASSFEESGGGERSCMYCRTSFRVTTAGPPNPIPQFPPPPTYTPPPKPAVIRLLQTVVVLFAVVFFIYWLVMFFSMSNKHEEFDRRFEERRKEIERSREGWPW